MEVSGLDKLATFSFRALCVPRIVLVTWHVRADCLHGFPCWARVICVPKGGRIFRSPFVKKCMLVLENARSISFISTFVKKCMLVLENTRSISFIHHLLKKKKKCKKFKCMLILENTRSRAGIARLVKRPTEKPGAILTQVRVPVRQDFFFLSLSQLPAQTLLRCPYSPLCAIPHASTCVRTIKKNPKHWQPYYCLDTHTHTQNCTHW